ncbi:DDE-type integrase/transposase/recombinase [Patescibacteria group bacterium]|nr:DDE-type integrase/transposase/recombinase [Patescibacteria group bacterium]
MNDSHMKSISQLKDFLKVGGGVSFSGGSREEKYKWIEWTLFKFGYFRLKKGDKSIVKKYIMKMTGYSDAQVTRLIDRKKKTHRIKVKQGNQNKFKKVYEPADVALLIRTDQAHGRLSGPATKTILRRECEVYGKSEYEKLSHISSSHIYNLRGTNQYRSRLGSYEKTKPTTANIGERRKPDNQGEPGYIRVDTVHQGDYVDETGQKKGVYHINLVDEVVQWEIVGSVEGISERFLKPLLEQLIKQFPFRIKNFHSDNGSEYINKTVAKLLNKMMIDQTKSRPRRSNDNGLVETKNGVVIRKHIGYAYIEQRHADKINLFYKTYFNPYLNYHRPCAFPTKISDPKKKGRMKTVYRQEDYLTPLQKLQTIKNVNQYFKPNMTLKLLQQFASQMSDTEAAESMQKAKYELFKSIKKDRLNH